MKIIGYLIVIASLIFSIWLTIGVLFVGGIVQVVEAIDPINAMNIAIGILKIAFCEIGFLPCVITFPIASAFIED